MLHGIETVSKVQVCKISYHGMCFEFMVDLKPIPVPLFLECYDAILPIDFVNSGTERSKRSGFVFPEIFVSPNQLR